MRTNAEGLALIKRYEGLRLKPYLCPGGVWTIGYGSTAGVTQDTPPITDEEAERLLLEDLRHVERDLTRMLFEPVNENQFYALASLTFNIGAGNFRRSTLRVMVNRRDYLGAADQFPRWNKAGGKELAGLTARRREERALFLKPVIISNNPRKGVKA